MKKCFISLLLLLPLQCLAWGSKGHATVADIAWQFLTPEARQQVDMLLKSYPFESLQQAANWPDHIRKQDEFKHTGNWHYVNLPRDAKYYLASRDCAQGCVVKAFNLMLQQLSNAADIKKRAEALAFVIHFVGDMHQPLHVSYADDKGGNSYPLIFKGETVNLHYYWDTLVLSEDPDDAALASSLIREMPDAQIVDWREDDAQVWIDESRQITAQIYANAPDKVTDIMLQQDRQLAHQRLIKAGVRLAFQLNQTLKLHSIAKAHSSQ
ncbi:S1/P1 nuclease [Neptunicella sp. SCSIO 80796]|uniref:S1/P1 nuclease n=1 Tax=Neptunicella plasticusilytica TaxID=3117012 RepID=UPI003A4D1CD4